MSKMRHVSTICLVACLLPSCTSSLQYTRLSLGNCIETGKLAMRDSDFTENLRVVRTGDSATITGEHGDYRGRISCLPDKRSVEVVGIDIDQANFYKKSIIRRL